MTENSTPPSPAAPSAGPTAPAPDAGPGASAALIPYVHVVVVSILGALAVLAWLLVYITINHLLWGNDLVAGNRWLFPVICIPFSLAAGLLVKHAKAPTTLDESLLDSLSGDTTQVHWRTLPVNIVMAWVSLFSGAVLGPEGGIGGIATKIAVLYGEKARVPAAQHPRLVFATLASAYNGLIASPLLTGVLGTELVPDPATRALTMPANLVGGAIGYLVFGLLGYHGLRDFLALAPTQSLRAQDIPVAVVLGLVGLACAILTGALFKASSAFFGRFAERPVLRALIAGVIFSIAGVLAPVLMFSGEAELKGVVGEAAAYGAVVLLAMALAKLVLLAVAFKSGFLGGPIFPAIFAAVCVAEAFGLLFPGVRIDLLIGGIMGGFLVTLFRAPFMVILLIAVMLQASPELIAMVILSVATVLVARPVLEQAMARRQAGRAAAAG